RQMNPLAKIFVFIDRRDDVRMKVSRKRRRELDSLHSGRSDCAKQTTEGSGAFERVQTVFDLRPITIYVLTNQMNLAIAMPAQLVDLGDDFGSGSTLFATARIRNNAVSAELVASFDDWNKGDVL